MGWTSKGKDLRVGDLLAAIITFWGESAKVETQRERK